METIEKPWGQEEILEVNDAYMVKRLTMRAGHRCSLQWHREKMETIYVLSGVLTIVSGPNADELEREDYPAGRSITIKPGIVHRMLAEGGDATYLEASTPQMEDVVRLADDYARAPV
ncbi:hypothetical protein FACS1894205_1800 [Alphaproteobacteria bacterium]|nr:hypothetical protein FACS1894205_1800 [Alphaproteobacteria bacterium]